MSSTAAAKTFVVTGASRGLGLAIAQVLLRSSHNVFLVARAETELKRLKQENPGTVDYLAADLSDFSVCLLAVFPGCRQDWPRPR